MLLTIAKWALVAFIIGAVAVFIVVYVRGARKVETQRDGPDLNMGPTTTWGVVAPTPLPDWAEVHEAGADGRVRRHEPPGQA